MLTTIAITKSLFTRERGYDSDSEAKSLFETLPEEFKTVVKVITKIISTQVSDKLVSRQKGFTKKDTKISHLENYVTCLSSRVDDLELLLNNVDQYERHGTVIPTGASLPPQTSQESTTSIVTTI